MHFSPQRVQWSCARTWDNSSLFFSSVMAQIMCTSKRLLIIYFRSLGESFFRYPNVIEEENEQMFPIFNPAAKPPYPRAAVPMLWLCGSLSLWIHAKTWLLWVRSEESKIWRIWSGLQGLFRVPLLRRAGCFNFQAVTKTSGLWRLLWKLPLWSRTAAIVSIPNAWQLSCSEPSK